MNPVDSVTGTVTANSAPGRGTLLAMSVPDAPTRRSTRALLALVAGLLICAAMPPWGWWPLAWIGTAVWAWLLHGRGWKGRLLTGVLVGETWYLPSTLWMVKFSPVGWPVGVAIWFPLVLGLVSAATHPRRTALTLPAAVVLGEWFRWHAPFGGVPLSMLAFTQARGPLLEVARTLGTLAVSGAVAAAGCALFAMARRPSRTRGVIGAVALVAVTLLSSWAPNGRAVRSIEVAAIQGGGPQQTRSANTDYRVVLGRHIDQADRIGRPVDLVVMPENIVAINGEFEGSVEEERLTELAVRLHTTLVAGIVDDRADPRHFWNYAVAIGPDGRIESRYDKVRRVPFGEYVPMRNLLEPFARDVLPPRDDVEGTGPAVLKTHLGRLGVVISWETFFPRRVREAVHHDAEIVLNPTNGSSYWLTQVQTQQIAASSLHAVESGRFVVQAAPTGFSAIIDPDGAVLQRTRIGEGAYLRGEVQLRRGRTLAMWWGEAPVLVASIAALAFAWALDRRHHRSSAPASAGSPETERSAP
ncbi:MAG: apolipoprotein N-acyltransferase [Microthrixaceae bacterium]